MKNDFKKRECISKGITVNFYPESEKFLHRQKKKYKKDKNIYQM